MNYWIAKSEPDSYSWDDFVVQQEEVWDGIRNYQARNYLKEMQLGDLVYFYHSGKERAIVGLAGVSEEAFPDPSDSKWTAVKLKVKKQLKSQVTLQDLKANDQLRDMKMLKQPRLSISPMSKEEFEVILKMCS